ncbi:MAG: beta-ketoacyl-ACP synthase III [Bacillota bacterium]|nr:beta-ketoacyl-ACP synthase III [Bacillota bacterium]
MESKVEAVGILGTGRCMPEKILTNNDLEKMVDTSDEWITKRTGISERRIIDEKTPSRELGIIAAQKALQNAGLSAEDLDLIIVTTATPDYLTPSTSCMIQNGINAKKAAAFDMNAACSGFIYGLTVAQQFIMNGTYKYILIVSCEQMSRVTDWKDRATCVLFGDGTGAAVLGPVEKGNGIIATNIGADGSVGRSITIPCCYSNDEDREKRVNDKINVINMDGSEVFKFAVKVMDSATRKVLDYAGVSIDDVALIIPHQANIRIIDGAAKRLDVSKDKIFVNVDRFGNISSASVPVALDEAVESGRIKKGDYVVLTGFGGGLTWASALIKW